MARINSLQGPFLFANRRSLSAKSSDCFNHQEPVTVSALPPSRRRLIRQPGSSAAQQQCALLCPGLSQGLTTTSQC